MTDSELIRTTMALYCRRADDGDFTAFAELFAPDGVLAAGGSDYQGRDAIVGFMEMALGDPSRRGKHITANTILEVGGDTAQGWSDYIVVAKDRSIASAGRYTDSLVRRGGTWMFSRRELTPLG